MSPFNVLGRASVNVITVHLSLTQAIWDKPAPVGFPLKTQVLLSSQTPVLHSRSPQSYVEAAA